MRGRIADSPQHHVASEVKDKQKADFNDITNVLHYMLQIFTIYLLSVILLFPNTVLV